MKNNNTAVVILNWNGSRTNVLHYLQSVVENTTAADIIFADNGSTDNSVAEVEQSFPQVQIIRLNKNYGFAEGYNRVLLSLNYTYFVLLNSDVLVPEGWLEPLIQRLESDKKCAVVAPKILSYRERGKFEYAGAAGGYIDYLGYPFCRGRVLNKIEKDNGQYDKPTQIFWASGAAMAVKADLYKNLGGLCGEFFAHMEEIDFCWRVQLAGYQVWCEPSSRVFHYGGATLAVGSPQKIFLNHRNNLAMLFRCATTTQRIVVAIARPILDFVAMLSYLAGGSASGAWAVVRAYADFIKWHGKLSKQRKSIRDKVTTEPTNIYKGSIVLRYFCGGKIAPKM